MGAGKGERGWGREREMGVLTCLTRYCILHRRAERRAALLQKNQAATHQPILKNAVSVAHRKLPPVPVGLKPDATTICLCYQYKEPAWNKKQHKAAITEVQRLARLHNVKGRGRCAPEGLNCTLTASAEDMRSFCYALRAWNPMFAETDFKVSMNANFC